MQFLLECKYCGHVFKDYFYDEQGLASAKCVKCGDKNLKAVRNDKTDIFGYNKNRHKDAYFDKDD